MRRMLPARAAAALLLAGFGGGCVLVSDLDHRLDGGGSGGGSSPSSGGTGGESPAGSTTGGATSTTTTTTTGGAGGEGGGPSSSSTGFGGAGGEGGGGAPHCTYDGEGPGAGPWSVTLGPVPREGVGAPVDTELDGERMVLGVVAQDAAPARGGPQPFLLGDRVITDGTEPRYVVGWIDDGGAASRAWPLTSAIPENPYATIDVEPLGDGRALVAMAGAEGPFDGGVRTVIVPVDLCDGTEEAPILNCDGQTRGPSIDVAADGRMAIALTVSAGADCDVLPASCALPAGMIAEDTVVFHLTPDGSCSSVLIREDDETLDLHSGQNAVIPALTDDGAVVVVGTYDGDLFAGEAAIATGKPRYLQDPANDRFHRFLARFVPQGATLQVTDAVDLGPIAFAIGGHGVVWRDGAAVVVAGSYSAEQPTGPFDPPVTVTGGAYLDVLAGVFPTPAGPTALQWFGGNSVDVPSRITSAPAGMMVAGWTTSPEVTPVGVCTDPAVVGDNGGLQGGGCAFFNAVDAQGAFGTPSVVGAAEAEALDVGLGAFALPGGDDLIVGLTSGTVQLDRAIGPAPDGFVQLYVARR